ncbi:MULTISPECIES: immunity 49 family protein [unclassified Nocardia]|uniref:immunity 49 family protein n=1 Tax=unclassified Nocardia TaxID=2637762 RepID=UPI0024A7F783|nr:MULTISPECIES: immunity 49 family protein [unclassified Nocardia]
MTTVVARHRLPQSEDQFLIDDLGSAVDSFLVGIADSPMLIEPAFLLSVDYFRSLCLVDEDAVLPETFEAGLIFCRAFGSDCVAMVWPRNLKDHSLVLLGCVRRDGNRSRNLLYPPVGMFHALYFKGSSEFNAALLEALELHRLYWHLNPDGQDDRLGSVSLPALAFAIMAHDEGVPIEVASGYLPKNFVNDSWPEVFNS